MAVPAAAPGSESSRVVFRTLLWRGLETGHSFSHQVMTKATKTTKPTVQTAMFVDEVAPLAAPKGNKQQGRTL